MLAAESGTELSIIGTGLSIVESVSQLTATAIRYKTIEFLVIYYLRFITI